MSLNDALTRTLTLYNHCFITFGASTFAVMKENLFCVFDSHSRGRDGPQVPNGRSVLIKYRSVSEVYEHCLKLAASMNLRCEVTQFEVTGVNVDVMNDQSVARQTTVAYTHISDAEIVLYTNHAQYPSHPLSPETCTNAVFGTKDCSVLYESADNPSHLQISSPSTAGSVMAGVSNKGKSTSSHRSVSRTRDKGRGQQKQHTQDEPRQTRAKTKAMTTNGANEFMSKQRKNLMCRKRYNKD